MEAQLESVIDCKLSLEMYLYRYGYIDILSTCVYVIAEHHTDFDSEM